MIKRFWNWLKSLFRRRAKAQAHVPTELEKKLAEKIQKRKGRWGRFVIRTPFGPRMPKRQPCPLCRRWVKRKGKTIGGAHYYCNHCNSSFFIRAK